MPTAEVGPGRLVRRIYLVLIIFLRVTTLLGVVAFLYRLFRNLGTTFGGPPLGTLSRASGATFSATVFLAYLPAGAARRRTTPRRAASSDLGGGRGALDKHDYPVDAALQAQRASECVGQIFAVDVATLAATRDLLVAHIAASGGRHTIPARQESPPMAVSVPG